VGRTDLRIGRLLLECDSITHHTSLENYHNDRRRDRRALVDGWLTMRITYDDVLYGWDGILADIRAITRPDRHRTTPRALKTAQ
jgi:very-short-patch-repair endonuclease